MFRFRWLVVAVAFVSLVLFVATIRRPFAPAASVSSLRNCNNFYRFAIDSAENVQLEKVNLQGERLTAWMWYTLMDDTLIRDPKAKLRDHWGFGYQLDDAPITDIHPISSETEMRIAISFSHLKPGAHRLRIGLVDSIGELTQDNAFCFSTPGQFFVKLRQGDVPRTTTNDPR